MPLTRIPDCAFELIDGDTVRLEQQNGIGDPVVIDLHRIHLAHLAEQMGITGGTEADKANRPAKCFDHRLLLLRELIAAHARATLLNICELPPCPNDVEVALNSTATDAMMLLQQVTKLLAAYDDAAD